MPENDNGSIYFSFTKRRNLNPLTHGSILNVDTHLKINQLHSNQLQPLRDLFRLEQERITENDTVPARVGGLSYKRLFKPIKTSQFGLNILKQTTNYNYILKQACHLQKHTKIFTYFKYF